MDEVDDIIGNSNNSNDNNSHKNSYNNQNRSNWQDKQNQDRQEAYDTMERMALVIKDDSNKFRQYLDIQSNFQKHSVGNCLIILDSEPNATQIRDKKSWKEKGYELISNPRVIKILEPSRSNTNNRVYYNPKEMYDISQTNSPTKSQVVKYDDRELLQAFIKNCDVPRKAVDTLPDGTIGTEYNKTENVLYVCRGMNRELLFQTLSQELANIEMKDEQDSDFKSFKSYCISYMLCKKYGVDVSNYEFNNLPNELVSKESGKEIRGEMDKIRIDFEKINSRIADCFENTNREKKSRVQER